MKKKPCIAAVLLLCMAVFLMPLEAFALSPALNTSEAYQTSPFYERLCAVELSGNYRRDLVAVALSQVGYHEGESKNDYAGARYDGFHNYTEYANAYFGMDGQWCAMFVTWCARQANIPKNVINSACGAFIDNSDDGKYAFRMTARYKKNYTPVPGDLVFFTTTGWGANHVGIVAGVTDSGIYTVEGNAMDAVRVKYYPLDSEEIVYYGFYSWQSVAAVPALDLSHLSFGCADGSNGKMPDGDPYHVEDLYAHHGSMITLPKGAFQRPGYTLAGYYAQSTLDGSWYSGGGWSKRREPTLLEDGESWCFDSFWAEAGDLTLYCVWKDSAGQLFVDSSSAAPVIHAQLKDDACESSGWFVPGVGEIPVYLRSQQG